MLRSRLALKLFFVVVVVVVVFQTSKTLTPYGYEKNVDLHSKVHTEIEFLCSAIIPQQQH